MNLPTEYQASVLYLTAPYQVEWRCEVLSSAKLGEADLLCETLVTAISPGTELGAYRGLPALRPGVTYPRLQGYCNVARVLAVGEGVRGVRTGDRVLSFTSHRSHFVLNAADVLLLLPEAGSAEEFVCAYFFHLGYDAVLRSGVRPGSRVVVVGLGVLGLASVALASVAGASVFGVTNHEKTRRIALAYGATAAFDRQEAGILRAALGEKLADVVIVTSNTWEDWQLSLELAGTRGAIACLGFPGRGAAASQLNPLDSQYFYAKQLTIMAAGMSPERPDSRGYLRFNERDNLRFLASLIESGRLRPEMLASATYSARDIDQAYRDLLERKDSPITHLLKWP